MIKLFMLVVYPTPSYTNTQNPLHESFLTTLFLQQNGEVTTGARDGAAHVLRCLKVWFDLPADVLINAINLFDR